MMVQSAVSPAVGTTEAQRAQRHVCAFAPAAVAPATCAGNHRGAEGAEAYVRLRACRRRPGNVRREPQRRRGRRGTCASSRLPPSRRQRAPGTTEAQRAQRHVCAFAPAAVAPATCAGNHRGAEGAEARVRAPAAVAPATCAGAVQCRATSLRGTFARSMFNVHSRFLYKRLEHPRPPRIGAVP
jgi:hypothetical protein